MNFENLVIRIQETNDFLEQNAVKAVNTYLTLRNWLTGFNIVEFEQNGSDSAEYGAKLLENIAKNIGVKGLTPPELSRCRQFYNCYPQILGLIPQEFKNVLPTDLLSEIADSDLDIFVSKYQLQLPDKAKLEAFINTELQNTK
jgi:hypothetical protein